MAGEIKVGMKFSTYNEKMTELYKRPFLLRSQGVDVGGEVCHRSNTSENGTTFDSYRLVTSKGFGWGAPKLPNGKYDESCMNIWTYAPGTYYPEEHPNYNKESKHCEYTDSVGFKYTSMGQDGKFNLIISPDGKQRAYDDNGNGIVDAGEIRNE